MALVSREALWEYQAAASSTPPVDPFTEVVPASSWLGPEPAPFGTLGDFIAPFPINTAWAVNTGIWLRRNVAVDGTAPVLITGRVENACFVYWDGEFIGGANLDNSNITGAPEWSVVVPADLADEGTHELALLCIDEPGSVSGDTTYIYVEADYLPGMLPLQPQAPVKETLGWLTDVMISENASEDRVQVRLSPRQSFRFTYPADAIEKSRAFNIVYGNRAREWLVPVWTQAQYLGAVSADLTTLTCDPDYSEFRASSLALLWQSPTEWQVVGVYEVGGSSLTLCSVTEAFTGAWLMPLRRGHVQGNPKKTFNGYNSQYDLQYEIDDNAALTVSAPTQYLSDDIYFEPSLFNGTEADEDILTKLDIQDEDLGVVDYFAPWTYNRTSRIYRVVAEDAQEAWALRQWLHRRAGRFRRFWQPSFEADMRVLSTGSITNLLIVANDENLRYVPERTHVAIEAGGTWYARAITDAELISETQLQITLSSSLGGIAASSIQRVCYLGLKRLDTDRIEITHLGAGVCQTEARVIEMQP